ncbi:MAG: hypothetical protein BWK77_08045 [Verrucomicrobia bacterium A1]|nr:MAG: hypothetical protein BWK77_08045 [Verrucomicrobia bacterium A1]
MDDTPRPVADLHYRCLMERSSQERVMMGIQMFETARRLVLASLPPDLSEVERAFALFLRLYGHEIETGSREEFRQRLLIPFPGNGRR